MRPLSVDTMHSGLNGKITGTLNFVFEIKEIIVMYNVFM